MNSVNFKRYMRPQSPNRLIYSITSDPPVAATFQDFVLTLIYPKHHLPQGQPLEEQYLDLLDLLEDLLDRADAGKNNVYLANFVAHVEAFLNHAQLDNATIHRLLTEQGLPADVVQWFDEEKWRDYRRTDLSSWTQQQRDELRNLLDYARMIQIVALEADPILNQKWYSYDLAGSLAGETVAVYGSSPSRNVYNNNNASHLGSAQLPAGQAEVYAYDHLNRRVVKDNGIQQVIYLYDLAGNLIAEANLADGKLIRQWFYVGSQRLAMIYPVSDSFGGTISVQCGGCSLAGGADGGAPFLGFMGLIFVGIGLASKRRKFTIAGLTFMGGVLFFFLMPEAKSQTQVTEQIYYYHNDHLGTPKVVTNQARAVVWDADYSPFGEISSYVINSLSVDQPFRFPGQYADNLTGWYYNWNRYYMPEEGRYNRVDPSIRPLQSIAKCRQPSEYNSTISKSFNNYLYGDNNIITNMDTLGLFFAGGVGGSAAAGVGASVSVELVCWDEYCYRHCCYYITRCFGFGLGASGGGFFSYSKGKPDPVNYSCGFIASTRKGGGGVGGGTYGVGSGPGIGIIMYQCCESQQLHCDPPTRK